MKYLAGQFKIAQSAAMFGLIALSGCGLLLGGYGEDPPNGAGGNGNGNGGSGESSTASSSGTDSGSGSGSSSSGSPPACKSTPTNIGLGEAPLILTGSTANEQSIRKPAITSNCSQQTSGPEQVYEVTAGADGILTIMTIAAGTKFDSVLYARKGDCNDTMTEYCADRTSAAHDLVGGEVLSFPVLAGEVWSIFIDGYDDVANGKGDYQLSLSLRTGKDGTSVVPVRFEVGSPMTLRGAIGPEGENDIFTFSCGGLGEVVYQIEYGAGIQSVKFDVVPLIGVLAPALYGTTTTPNGAVSPAVGCNAAGCGESETITTTPNIKFLVVDGALPGFDVCSGAKEGAYNLVATPTPAP